MTTIRRATGSDLEAVARLEASVFADVAWSRASVEEEFAAIGDTRRVFVAVDGDEVVGYAVLRAIEDSADLTRVAVDVTRRRAGVGSRLVDAAVDESREMGLRRILLEVADGNAAAVALYATHGFEQIDRRPAYYSDGSDAVVMSRRLDRAAEEARR
jgi:ribosomal-protein-alanine N-acetyltransferase